MTTNPSENDPDTLAQIMYQVEFYMSEGNLGRDNFFKQQIEKRSDSGLPLSLLLNCNRLRALNVTEDLLKRAITNSSLLELSSDGLAVIRKYPLSELKSREKRTILVTGIPQWPSEPDSSHPETKKSNGETSECSATDPNHSESVTQGINPGQKIAWQFTDKMRDIFSQYGEVLYVSLPQYFSSGFFRGFAFVEFKSPKSAKAAIEAMAPKAEDEYWHMAPSESESEKYPDCAWKPRLATKASFPAKQMLGRRYVWRCCSRKNKQIQSAFKQLRDCGYRALNPCDREYDLITLGDASPEFKLQYKQSCYGDLAAAKLRVFSYSTWQFWRSKFYEWLNAWISRMKLKAEKLSAKSNQMNSYSTLPTDCKMSDQNEDSCGALTDAPNSKSSSSPKPKDKINLPVDYIPNSVIQFYWPATLIPPVTNLHKKNPNESLIEPELVFKQNVSFARRLRISLEKNILAPFKLLDQVAYVDPSPNDELISELENTESFKPPPDQMPGELFPIFIRMKSVNAASLLIQSVQNLKTDQSLFIYCRQLTGLTEERYCQFISDSHLRAKERRRLNQARRRERLHSKKQEVQPHLVNKSHQTAPQIASTHKHIVFNE